MEIYKFDDGYFQFFTACRKASSYVIIFRVRRDVWPEKRAREKSIKFDYIRPSSVMEVKRWLKTHDDYPVREKTMVEIDCEDDCACGLNDSEVV